MSQCYYGDGKVFKIRTGIAACDGVRVPTELCVCEDV